MKTYKLGGRLSFDGELCTIKFIGPIRQWGPNTDALGIEWDNPARGKNDGGLNGIQYFNCRIKNSGSFIKSGKICDEAVGFYDALKNKYFYSDKDEFEPIKVGRSKTIETVGIDKVAQYHAHISSLEMISLSRYGVIGRGNLGSFTLESLRRLDLSYNLFSSIKDVVEIIQPLKGLQSLVLNGNRFSDEEISEGERLACPQILELSLASTLIAPREIKSYLKNVFVSVEVLNISSNLLEEIPRELLSKEEGISPFLRSVDLSWNQISDLDSVPRSADIKRLEELNLSHNNISNIRQTLNCEVLDLGYNSISDWLSIDTIGGIKILKSLRINSNPIFNSSLINTDNESNDNDNSPFIIARTPTITKFNGYTVSDKERTEAELYFMSKVSSGEHPLDRENCTIWKKMVENHGEPLTSSSPVKDTIKSRLLTLEVLYKSRKETFKILKTSTIQKLRATVAKKFALSPFEITLSQSNQVLDSNIDPVSKVIIPDELIIVEDKT